MQVIRQLAPCLYYLMFHPPSDFQELFFGVGSIKNFDQPVHHGNKDDMLNIFAGNGQWKNGLGGPNDKAEEGIEYGSI